MLLSQNFQELRTIGFTEEDVKVFKNFATTSTNLQELVKNVQNYMFETEELMKYMYRSEGSQGNTSEAREPIENRDDIEGKIGKKERSVMFTGMI